MAFARIGPWTDNYHESQDETVPGDVRNFVVKAQGCGHFSGEAGDDNDSERVVFLRKQTDKLCTGLRETRAKLVTKYPDNPAAQKIIADTWETYGFD